MMTVEKKELSRFHAPFFEKHVVDKRLTKVFENIPADFHFLTTNTNQNEIQGKSLLFTFDHGVDRDFRYSGPVVARLYLDRKIKAFCLAIWPLPNVHPPTWLPPNYPQILMEDVDDLKFRFYNPPSDKVVDPSYVGKVVPNRGWNEEWFDEYKTLPALLEITLKKEGESDPVVFLFEMPYSLAVVYRGGV